MRNLEQVALLEMVCNPNTPVEKLNAIITGDYKTNDLFIKVMDNPNATAETLELIFETTKDDGWLLDALLVVAEHELTPKTCLHQLFESSDWWKIRFLGEKDHYVLRVKDPEIEWICKGLTYETTHPVYKASLLALQKYDYSPSEYSTLLGTITGDNEIALTEELGVDYLKKFVCNLVENILNKPESSENKNGLV